MVLRHDDANMDFKGKTSDRSSIEDILEVDVEDIS